MPDLSPTMQSAIYYTKKHGNKIVRYPGGFWARTGWDSQAAIGCVIEFKKI